MADKDVVYETCLVLVRHFRNLMEHGEYGFHSRIFEHMLHPEEKFVLVGKSKEALESNDIHPEHIVPCAVLISETQRLIKSGHQDEYIAGLLKKHWKVAHISKREAKILDQELRLKSTMPDAWTLENGDTFARLKEAKIELSGSSES